MILTVYSSSSHYMKIEVIMKKLLNLLVILLATVSVGLFSMDQYGAESALSKKQEDAMELERLQLEQERLNREVQRLGHELRRERQARQQEAAQREREVRQYQNQNPNARRRLDF